MPRMHEPVIEGKYKVTGDTRVVRIFMKHKEDEIQWAFNKSISTDAREPETLKESMSRPSGHLCKMSVISEVNHFLSRKACIVINIITVKEKCIKPVPAKWVFNSNEDI